MKTQKPYYITTEKISVGYDGKPLIEEVEIALRKGEILTLLGPNGAGKSTILKSIARQLSLIAGTVRLDGEDMRTLTGAELSKKMAVVMTKRLRAELMTCEDVVATGRYPYTGRFGVLRAEDHAAVQNAMELVQVAEIGDSLFDRISDGQRQRVMLARAICQEPEILILDEPTSYLDVRHKLEFLSILQKLCRERQLTVILSLHELELAEKIKKLRSEIEKQSSQAMTTDMFISLVRKYTRARKLTPRMLNELVEKIEVYHAEKIDGVWEQRLRIHYNCVGEITIPKMLLLPIPDVTVNTRKGVFVNYTPAEIAG